MLNDLLQSEIDALEDPALAARALFLAQSIENVQAQSLFHAIYPEEDGTWDGPALLGGLIAPGQTLYARSKYAKHLEFFEATKTHRETCFMAANRVGKTFGGGGFAMACHLTGLYPDWWPGRKFRQPISAWAAGDTFTSTRDVVQSTLLGAVTWRDNIKAMDGRGIVPGDLLGRCTWHSGVADLVDTQIVKHFTDDVYDGNSIVGFKSYDQGRRTFQGTGRHVIWFDEEPPMNIYGEALIRTATVGGIVMLTFTPLLGYSQVVLSFMPSNQRPEL